MRTMTGIKGFDPLINGGFPKGSTILLSGTPGTGKTIFALQYLYNGFKKYNDTGLFITFEQKAENLLDQARQFGWDFQKLEGNVDIWYIPPSTISKSTVDEIIKHIKERKISRLVIDSLSTLSFNIPTAHTKLGLVNDYSVRQFIYSFIDKLRSLNSTNLVISQTSDSKSLSKDTVSEFICDGVIHLVFESLGGEFSRNLLIRKLRQTKHDEDIHPLEISKTGLIVHSLE